MCSSQRKLIKSKLFHSLVITVFKIHKDKLEFKKRINLFQTLPIRVENNSQLLNVTSLGNSSWLQQKYGQTLAVANEPLTNYINVKIILKILFCFRVFLRKYILYLNFAY